MRLYQKCGPAGLLALLLPLVATTAFATTSAQPKNSPAMMQMPMIAPLVIQDGDFNSTLVLVNGTDVPTYADVALRSLDGQTVATERVQFPPYGKEHVNIRELRNSGTAPGMTAGSLTIMQNPAMTGMAVIAALAMTRDSEPVPNYIVQELVAPSTSGSQVLRGVADSSDGSPLVSISSLDSMPQHVTIRCIRARARPFSKTVDIGPDETLLTAACAPYVEHGLDFNGYLDTLAQKPLGPIGIELISDAMPGSFAAFGLVPHRSHEGLYFGAVPFTDPMTLKSTTTIYTGVPVGSSPLLTDGRFTPVLALTNFSAAIRHVTVEYALSRSGATPTLRTVKTLTLAPLTSREIALRGLTGDSLLQDSFIIQSDGSPGDIGVKLVSRSHTALHEVESLGKDLDDPNNGGNHPWTVANGTTSTLLLFNNTTAPQYFNVEISAGTVVWRKAYQLQPMETKAISINNLIRTGAKEDNGTKFPRDVSSGQIEWHMPVKDAGRGRILESNPEIDMARSFSCGVTIELCDVFFDPVVEFVEDGEITYFGSAETEVCMNSCSGTPVGSGGSGYNYDWSIEDSTIASISGSDSSDSVTLEGNSPGTTELNGEASDSYCEIPVSSPAPVLSISQSPSSISMSTGDTNQSVTVSTNPSTFASGVTINHSLTSNPHSADTATASFTAPATFTGDDHWTISATGSDSPSGIFSANACVDGTCAAQTTTITIPPLCLIQVLYGEAEGQARSGDSVSEPAIGSAIENRLGKSAYPGGSSSDWQPVIEASNQFAGYTTGKVVTNSSYNDVSEYELPIAVSLFNGTVGDIVGGSGCFFSPSQADWNSIDTALKSGATTYPTIAKPEQTQCYVNSPYGAQIVYKSSIGVSSVIGDGVPAFVFQRPRASASAPAVVEIP